MTAIVSAYGTKKGKTKLIVPRGSVLLSAQQLKSLSKGLATLKNPGAFYLFKGVFKP